MTDIVRQLLVLKDLKNVLHEAEKMGCKVVTFRGIPIENIEAVISALEMRDAKAPVYDGNGYAPDGSFVWDEWICPHCSSRYEVEYDEHAYCPNCGQKIDWRVPDDFASEIE